MLARTNNRIMFSDRFYSIIKKLVQVILPAFSALYFSLDSIWDLPSEDKVVGTLAVVTTFLGVSLGISSHQYSASGAAYNGNVVVSTSDTGDKKFSLELDDDPINIEDKEAISFKVQKNTISE